MNNLKYLLVILLLLASACDEESSSETDTSEPQLDEYTLDFGKNEETQTLNVTFNDGVQYLKTIENNNYGINFEQIVDENKIIVSIDRNRFPFGKTELTLKLPFDNSPNEQAKREQYSLQKRFEISIDIIVEKVGEYEDYIQDLSFDGVYISEFLVDNRSILGTFELNTNQSVQTAIAAFKSQTDLFVDAGDEIKLVGSPESKIDNTVSLVKKDFEYVDEEITFDAFYYQPASIVVPGNRLIFDGSQEHQFKVPDGELFGDSLTTEIISAPQGLWESPESNIDINSDLVISTNQESNENLYFWAVLSSSESPYIFRISNIEESIENGVSISSEKLTAVKEYGESATLWLILTRVSYANNYVVMSQNQKSYEVTLN
jgi:hypothetical protein